MQARKVALAGVSVAVLVVGVTTIACGPLRQPESSIRNGLLDETPLGSPMGLVRSKIEQHGWELAEFREDLGYLDQRTRPNRVVGEKHIRAELGSYQGLPWRTHVTVFWGFDEQGKLVDIWVWKTRDTL